MPLPSKMKILQLIYRREFDTAGSRVDHFAQSFMRVTEALLKGAKTV